jgi:UDP-N-acetylmuramate dehydrogenase
VSVTTIDRHGVLRERNKSDYDIGYRHVEPRAARPDEWYVAARFHFPDGDEARAKARIKEWLTRRIETQPLEQPNAGSTFANPHGDHAARLIESCGLKGFSIGSAQVSPKHANFIVNLGGARAKDIEALIRHMRDMVLARTGVVLQQEVRIIGDAL